MLVASVNSPCRRSPLEDTIPGDGIAPCRGAYPPRRFRRERKLRSQQLQNLPTDCYITFLFEQKTGLTSLLPSAVSTLSQIIAMMQKRRATYNFRNTYLNVRKRTHQ
jgi:hypothetical protein